MCGKWRLAEFEQKVYVEVGSVMTFSYQILMRYGQAKVIFQGNEVDAFPYVENWEINKDGRYSIETKSAGELYEETGKWSWCGKDKSREYEKKECVYLTCSKYIYNKGEEVAEYSGKSLSPSRMIALTRLSKDEILLFEETNKKESDGTPIRVKTTSRLTRIDD